MRCLWRTLPVQGPPVGHSGLAHHELGRRDFRDHLKSAGALSRWILWNKPTLAASIKDYKKRFGL
jgi:hypothetical protein